jgi:hypothetical protein
MYCAEIVLQSLTEYDGPAGNARRIIVLRALLEAVCVANWQYLVEHPTTPRLYERQPPIQYALKTRAGEKDVWQDLPATYTLGIGDCKDLACIRVAELRASGVSDAVPFIRVANYLDPEGVKPPLLVHHVQVCANGKIEDPSEILGMPKTMRYRDLLGQADAAGIANARWGSREWARARQ